MPDVQSSTLRIYCLCGQKMRVSEKMYGLPGKCVACRTKIRIPRKKDVPAGVTDIHLKDHPELVRGPVKAPSSAEQAARKALAKAGAAQDDGEESTPNTELDLADSPPPQDAPVPAPAPSKSKRSSRGGSLALDTLPMLQLLCSLDYKFSRQLGALQLNSHDDEVLLAELEGHVARVHGLRVHLDDQLHQRLMETAIELANTQEKLAQARLGARVGETSWGDYQTNVHRLRARRERLERRQQNLRGWLATRDPHLAGGLLDLAVENIPEDGFTVSLPAESGDESPLLVEQVENLRTALEHRTHVRQRAAEVQKMSEKDASREVEELRKECEQQRLVARAGVAFAHDRLQQLKKDYASDVETTNAMMAASRDKLRMNAITRSEYDAFEKDILRAKKDIARAQSIIERALGANAATDVPAPHGTFLQRMGIGRTRKNTPDILLAYASAVLLVLAIFAPSVGTMSLVSAALEFGGDGGAAAWLFLAPLALAAAAGAITLAGEKMLRFWLYLAAWLCGLIAATYLIHESDYSLSSIAARFRLGGQWYLWPGEILALGGIFGLFVAAMATLWHDKSFVVRTLIGGVAGSTGAAGALVVALIVTDFGGTFRPAVRVELEVAEAGAGVVRVTNVGGRSIRLLDRKPDARGTYLFMIERRVGAGSWGESRGIGPLWDKPTAENGIIYSLAPNASQEVGFVLPPGDYRVVLDAVAPDAPTFEAFSIAAPAQDDEVAASAGGDTPIFAPSPASPGQSGETGTKESNSISPATDAGAEGDDTNAPNPVVDDGTQSIAADDTAVYDPNAAPEIELTGIVTSEADEPRFSLRIYYADGSEDRLLLGMGGTVWAEWKITEFNPDQGTVTVQDPDGLLILRRRVVVALTHE